MVAVTQFRMADWIREDIEEHGEDIDDLLTEYFALVNPSEDDTYTIIRYDESALFHLRFIEEGYDENDGFLYRRYWDEYEVNNFLDHQGYN